MGYDGKEIRMLCLGLATKTRQATVTQKRIELFFRGSTAWRRSNEHLAKSTKFQAPPLFSSDTEHVLEKESLLGEPLVT